MYTSPQTKLLLVGIANLTIITLGNFTFSNFSVLERVGAISVGVLETVLVIIVTTVFTLVTLLIAYIIHEIRTKGDV